MAILCMSTLEKATETGTKSARVAMIDNQGSFS
jgi:hypothetical protein